MNYPLPPVKYASFLVCFHPTHTDVFLSGVPLMTLRDGKTILHPLKNPDGTPRPIDFMRLDGNPFGSVEELQASVAEVTARMADSDLANVQAETRQ